MARVFNGSTDSISAPAIGTGIDISSGPMSVSFWFYPTTLSTEHDVVSKWGGSGSNSQYLISTGVSAFGASGNQLGFCIGSYAAVTGVYAFVSTALSVNNWYQCVVTVDTASTYSLTPTVIMMLAGAATGQTSTPFRERRPAGGVNLTIAGQNGGGNYVGRIAQLGIWNACLSPKETIALQAGVSPSRIRALNLQGYWPLYGASSAEPDLSGHGLVGTLHGAPSVSAQPIGTAY
jgi:hypothetical protein